MNLKLPGIGKSIIWDLEVSIIIMSLSRRVHHWRFYYRLRDSF